MAQGNIPQYSIERKGLTDIDIARRIATLNNLSGVNMTPYAPTMTNGHVGVMMVVANATRTLLVDVPRAGVVKHIEDTFWDVPDYTVVQYGPNKFLIEVRTPELVKPSTIEQI